MKWIASLVFRLSLIYVPIASIIAVLGGNLIPLSVAIVVFIMSAIAKEVR